MRASPIIAEACRWRMRVGPLAIVRRRALVADTHGNLTERASPVLRRLCAWPDGSAQMELVSAVAPGRTTTPDQLAEVQVTVALAEGPRAERGALWMAIVLGLAQPGDSAAQAWLAGGLRDLAQDVAPRSPVGWFGDVAASLRLARPLVTLVLTRREGPNGCAVDGADGVAAAAGDRGGVGGDRRGDRGDRAVGARRVCRQGRR